MSSCADCGSLVVVADDQMCDLCRRCLCDWCLFFTSEGVFCAACVIARHVVRDPVAFMGAVDRMSSDD